MSMGHVSRLTQLRTHAVRPQRASRSCRPLTPQPLDATGSEVKTFQFLPTASAIKLMSLAGNRQNEKTENTGVHPVAVTAVKARITATATLLVIPDINALHSFPMSPGSRGSRAVWCQEAQKGGHSRLRYNKNMKAPTAAFRPVSAGADTNPR